MTYSQRRVEDVLEKQGIRLVTHDGAPFSAEVPAEPVNPEDFDTDEGLVVSETIEPTVIFDGRILARGLVVLAKGN